MVLTESLNATTRDSGGVINTNAKQDMVFINIIKARQSALSVAHEKHNINIHPVDSSINLQVSECFQSSTQPVSNDLKKSSSHPTTSPTMLPENAVNHSIPKSARFN